jgi:hypothetical protein
MSATAPAVSRNLQVRATLANATNAPDASTALATPIGKSFRDWLEEGESLYEAALSEYLALEAQAEQMESRLAEKRNELNRIAAIVGRPILETRRRVSAQLVDETGPGSIPNSPATIARALTGRGLAR